MQYSPKLTQLPAEYGIDDVETAEEIVLPFVVLDALA
jgi:hypothetical protein